ncbi:MAG: N-acetylglucosamine-6-phosphate deacetylase [bacterium]|nr:N-acetylglucosamine-6-phosphate deacetylase [bacterium]
MLFESVLYYGADFRFHTGDVETEGSRIAAVRPRDCTPQAMLLPGLVDIHLHGNSGADFSDGSAEEFCRMARFLAAHGTTSFSAATLTLPEEQLAAACRAAAAFHAAQPEGAAALRGITLEGPFFSMGKRGAQNPDYLRLPDAAMFARLQREAEGSIRIACVAPELQGAIPFIRAVARGGVTVSVAHTEAGYDAASAAFEAGATHVTHLYNAMPPLLHRTPGVIGAASERENVTAELIADGVHVHPSAVRAAFRLFPGRICLISDALSACGMPDGEYLLGGQKIRVAGPRATLADGTLAGSVATLFDCLKNAVRFGIPAEEAVRAASCTPARVIGADGETGAIRAGLAADLLLCSLNWELQKVYVGGRPVADESCATGT